MSDKGKNPETGEELREKRYRMSDNYCRFCLKFVEPAKTVIDRDEYEFAGLDALENVDSVKGNHKGSYRRDERQGFGSEAP